MTVKDEFQRQNKLIVPPGSKVDLSGIDTDFIGDLTKKQAKKGIKKLRRRLGEAQRLLYAGRQESLLIVLQGMDTGGKDGIINAISKAVNAKGCRVMFFRAPSAKEMSYDFLRRAHHEVPPKGLMTIFHRSHYEEVLITRVHGLVPEEDIAKRYGHINDFERMLTDNGTHVLKFFLHMGEDEQLERLKERLNLPKKQWKVTENDFKERRHWDKYQEAYEIALSKCSTEHAPWHIIPADKKWFRDYAVLKIVTEYLEGLDMHYPEPEVDEEEIRRIYLRDQDDTQEAIALNTAPEPK